MTGDPPSDRPDMPPWLEDVEHLCVVLDDLERQAVRAVEGGTPPGEVSAALAPLCRRLGRIHQRLWEELLVRQLGAEVDTWGET